MENIKYLAKSNSKMVKDIYKKLNYELSKINPIYDQMEFGYCYNKTILESIKEEFA